MEASSKAGTLTIPIVVAVVSTLVVVVSTQYNLRNVHFKTILSIFLQVLTYDFEKSEWKHPLYKCTEPNIQEKHLLFK